MITTIVITTSINEWVNEWMYESTFHNSKLQNQSKLLKLITFSWYVDDNLAVWFNRNLQEWNLSLTLTLTLTLTLNLVLPSLVFHNIFFYHDFYDFIIFRIY